MAVLTYLCFASLIYFTLSDPVPQSGLSKIPTSAEMKEKTDALNEETEKFINSSLKPILEGLDQPDIDYLEDFAERSIKDILNLIIFLAREQLDPKSASGASNQSDDNVYIQFLSQSGTFLPGKPDQSAATAN